MSGASVFLMSCGTPEFRFPDDWMTTPAWAGEAVMDSHVSKWWSSAFPSLVHAGDIAVLVATKSGKVMGAFEIAGEPVEDRPHPRDNEAGRERVDAELLAAGPLLREVAREPDRRLRGGVGGLGRNALVEPSTLPMLTMLPP